jgi:hypothetical protein
MGTGIMNGTGELSADGKKLTWMMKGTDPASGKEFTMREVETFIDENTHLLEFFMPMPDGQDLKMMEIRSTRKGGTPGAKKEGIKPAGH